MRWRVMIFVTLLASSGAWLTVSRAVPTTQEHRVDSPDAARVDTNATEPDTTALISVDLSTERPDTGVTDAHPQDSPRTRGFLIRTSDGRAQMRLRGSIRLVGLYDLNGLQNNDVFATYDIPVGEQNLAEPRFVMDARQTRFGIEMSHTSEELGESILRIEADFFGSAGEDDVFRLRHAYGTFTHFLAGQTWTTLGDLSALPLTVDFEGPNSAITIRSPQIRYSTTARREWRLAIALETPKADFSLPDSATTELAFQSFPDVVSRLRKQFSWGHLQLAGVYRNITYRDASKSLRYAPGYGGVVSGTVGIGDRNEMHFQAYYGLSISRYVSALSGRGLDLLLDPTTNELEQVESGGGYVAVKHQWRQSLSSNVVSGIVTVQNKIYQPDDAYYHSEYVAANTFFDFNPGTRLGVECLWGRRENKGGESGTATRVQFALYYDF